MTARELAEQVGRLRDGTELPRRVVVNAEGLAQPPWRALRDHGVTARLVFVRSDGWTLGCPVALAGVAFAMWAGSWVALCEVPCRPIEPPCDN